MYIFNSHLRPYSLIVLGYMLAFFAVATKIQNTEFLFYQITMLIMIAIVVYMDKRVKFSRIVLSGLTLWGFIHLAGGLIPIPATWTIFETSQPVLYDLKPYSFTPKYDQIVHALGFGICLLAAYESLKAHLQQPLSLTFPVGVSLFLIAMGLGAINEMIEFIAVISIPNTNVGGYINTGWDLVSNATGGLISIIYLKIKEK